ncbi:MULTISPECIES: shikimate kinase [unclassified Lysobacter]|uniref:shikimate kinase n=1 Tax=unclassified Lysobacter TaxID=2635362 RepID=UPI0006FEDBD5|nr:MULTISPECIES: shikimate kinase [unclassified Lysobacter]KRA76898.1 shikimate kinase [Lysobacter sp. Root667]KRC38672.1 shikimate kinase [Lysobacter sp. Root76]KRD71125.1 shikimate kinase [Lysobacter sp. Root96]
MNPASNLILVGPMGAGKSCIGRRLAERYGLRLADADREIEQRTGTTVATIFECEGEAGFRARERATLAELLAADGLLLATGGGAVLDPDSRALLRERGYVVHLQVSVEAQLERLARDRTRPLLARDDREDVLRTLSAQRAPLYADVADLRFDTERMTAAEAADKLADQLDIRWRRLAHAHGAPA